MIRLFQISLSKVTPFISMLYLVVPNISNHLGPKIKQKRPLTIQNTFNN